jgi:5-methylthioadenosine/S-adenosylhomocysteine deaminase
VEHVWVAGRQLLKQRRLTTLDENNLLEKAEEWQKRIASHSEKPATPSRL